MSSRIVRASQPWRASRKTTRAAQAPVTVTVKGRSVTVPATEITKSNIRSIRNEG